MARPVIIARMRLRNPARTTIPTWTTRNKTRNPETKKCSVRADCRPPNKVTAAGTAETKAGDIASPVQITRGKRTKITHEIGCPLNQVVGTSVRFIRRVAAKILSHHVPIARQLLSPGAGNRSFRKWPLNRLEMA